LEKAAENMEGRAVWLNWKRAVVAAAGIVLGATFLWLATRYIGPDETEKALREMDLKWLAAGVASYLAAIALRCLRWGILVRATGSVKWRHTTEALITGFAANYVLPGRVGELFRADYARRVFNMSRFTALGRSWSSAFATESFSFWRYGSVLFGCFLCVPLRLRCPGYLQLQRRQEFSSGLH
jgi:uncharacterized membrane protein YbhN (UPF0104 family)